MTQSVFYIIEKVPVLATALPKKRSRKNSEELHHLTNNKKYCIVVLKVLLRPKKQNEFSFCFGFQNYVIFQKYVTRAFRLLNPRFACIIKLKF